MDDLFAGDLVTLRPMATDDGDDLAAYLNEPGMRGLRQMEQDPLAPLSTKALDDVVADWSNPKNGLALVVSPTGEEVIVGHIVGDWQWDAHAPFVGLAIAPQHRGRGYGSGALDLMLAFLFEQTVAHTVQVWTPSWNSAGVSFLEATGFSAAGAIRRAGRRDDRWYDDLAFEQLKREWGVRR
jgi:RimJ/RimL family protein N-acetyltransferase